MSSDVVLTSALRTNLLSLQNTQRLIDETQLKLATGLKVNSALDNPQNFFTAQNLNNRAGDLGRLLDGISQSVRTIETADNGITALTDLVEQAESVALEAQSEARAAEGFASIRGTVDLRSLGDLEDGVIIDDTNSDQFNISITRDVNGTTTTTTLAADINLTATATVDDIVAAINGDANVGANASTQLVRASVGDGGELQIESLVEGGLLRINEGAANSVTAAGFARLGLDNVVGTEQSAATTRQSGTAVAGTVITSAAANTASQVNGEFVSSATLLSAGYYDGSAAAATVDITLTVDGQAGSAITVTELDTIQDVIDGINTDATLSSAGVQASFNTTTGRIEIDSGNSVGQLQLTVDNASAANQNVTLGFGTLATNDADLDNAAGEGNSEIFTFVGTSTNLDQFQSDFNNIRSQIDDLVEDANYRGINLLNGDDLETDFNEDRSSTLTTEGVTFDSSGLGIAEGDFTSTATISASISDVRNALASVRDFGSSIANDLAIIQTRRDFTEQTINTLEAGADDLTVADQNEEGANLLSLQTRQTLGVTSLSLASQSQQAVLRLF